MKTRLDYFPLCIESCVPLKNIYTRIIYKRTFFDSYLLWHVRSRLNSFGRKLRKKSGKNTSQYKFVMTPFPMRKRDPISMFPMTRVRDI